jgi:16S rRNA (guanine966-N2)-methyltransferase
VIGGILRRRTIPYNGDPELRPMKDRVRESVFNLVGPRVVGKHVLDLFAGTGAMTFEALSRGAASATLFERKFPTAKLIETTASEFGLADRITMTGGDAFIWAKRLTADPLVPWLVFCCPPYEFYVSRRPGMFDLVTWLWNAAPAESLFVIESDERFGPAELISGANWDVRTYPPAVIGIAEKP